VRKIAGILATLFAVGILVGCEPSEDRTDVRDKMEQAKKADAEAAKAEGTQDNP